MITTTSAELIRIQATVRSAELTPLGHLTCELDTAESRFSAIADPAVASLLVLTPGTEVQAALLRLRSAKADSPAQWRLLCCRITRLATTPSTDSDPMTTQTTNREDFTAMTPTARLDVTRILPAGTLSTLIGRVSAWQPGSAGVDFCTLRLSFGDIQLEVRRQDLFPHLQSGQWACVRLMRGHGRHKALVRSAQRIDAPAVEMAWLPTSTHHRHAHVLRLRSLLGRLAPSLQAIFTTVMAQGHQHHFLNRIAALDHHVYPGGLFDQSVEAADLAFHAHHASVAERDLATLVALLHDIGKTSVAAIEHDTPRLTPVLAPHPLSRIALARSCLAVSTYDPETAHDVLALLSPEDVSSTVSDREARLRHHVAQAVIGSWTAAAPDRAYERRVTL